jgi:hypothetical protein
MCAPVEIWEACWHVSRPELHARSRDVNRVTEVWICTIEFNVKFPLTSQLHALTSHELTWREDSVSPALHYGTTATARVLLLFPLRVFGWQTVLFGKFLPYLTFEGAFPCSVHKRLPTAHILSHLLTVYYQGWPQSGSRTSLMRLAQDVKKNNILVCVISNFCRDVNEICALLGCYAAIVVIPYRRFGTTYSSHF